MVFSIVSKAQGYMPQMLQDAGEKVPAIRQLKELLANPLKGGAKLFVKQATKAIDLIPGYNTSPLAQEIKSNLALIESHPEDFAISAGAAWAGIKGAQTSSVLSSAAVVSNLIGMLPYMASPFAKTLAPLTGMNVPSFVNAIKASDLTINGYFLLKPAANATGPWASHAVDALLALNIAGQYVKAVSKLDEANKDFESLNFEPYMEGWMLQENECYINYNNGAAVINEEDDFSVFHWIDAPASDKSDEAFFVDCEEYVENQLIENAGEVMFHSFSEEATLSHSI